MALLTDVDRARQLAEAIASDVRLYNGEKIAEVTDGDRKVELLADEIAEGRDLFLSRVSPEIQVSGLYEQVIAEAFGASRPAEQPSPPPPQLRFDEPVPGQEPGSSAYREAEIKALCLTCNELAFTPCRRCGAPLCAQHAPPRGARCASCEAEYARREKRWGFSAWKTHLLLFGAVAVAALGYALFSLDKGMVSLVIALVAGALALVLPFKLDRWLFLLERKHNS